MNQPVPAVLALTMGDPCGIGPEIVIKTVAAFAAAKKGVDAAKRWGGAALVSMIREALGVSAERWPDLLVVGDAQWLSTLSRKLDIPEPDRIHNCVRVTKDLPTGRVDARAGEAAFQCIIRAASLTMDGSAKALITAPISKEALWAAGHVFPGHTELLADLSGVREVRMMLVNSELRVVLASGHMPLHSVASYLSVSGVHKSISLANHFLQQVHGLRTPRLAVAGLNPHAGEGGRMGSEEAEIITPAIALAQSEGVCVSGPYAPDTVFMRARKFREFDAVVAMYHDQALIPIKYLGIDQGVNITLGLPFVRTSPDHGTAFDCAGVPGADGHGVADASSLVSAVLEAWRLSPFSHRLVGRC